MKKAMKAPDAVMDRIEELKEARRVEAQLPMLEGHKNRMAELNHSIYVLQEYAAQFSE